MLHAIESALTPGDLMRGDVHSTLCSALLSSCDSASGFSYGVGPSPAWSPSSPAAFHPSQHGCLFREHGILLMCPKQDGFGFVIFGLQPRFGFDSLWDPQSVSPAVQSLCRAVHTAFHMHQSEKQRRGYATTVCFPPCPGSLTIYIIYILVCQDS